MTARIANSADAFFRPAPAASQTPAAAPAAPAPAATPIAPVETGFDAPPEVSVSGPEAQKVVEGWSKDWKAELDAPRDPAEQSELEAKAASVMKEVQTAGARPGCPLHRGFQAKGTYATGKAELAVSPDLPAVLSEGPFQAGAKHRAIVRFSNASNSIQSDGEADQRSVAIRITDDHGKFQDILLTSGSSANHAKDAQAFLAGAEAKAKGGIGGIFGLARDVGPIDAVRMLVASKLAASEGKSLAAESFFGRAPFKLGEHAVHIRLVPKNADETTVKGSGKDSLRQDFVTRRAKDDITYELQVQGYTDPDRTPMNDHRKEWEGPWVTIGQLTFPKQRDLEVSAAKRAVDDVDKLSFSPFNQWDGALEPLGDLNKIRKVAYEESAKNTGRVSSGGCPYLRA